MDYDPNQDLEYVLKTSEYIRSKCTSSRSYSENLYRALCDVVWILRDSVEIWCDGVVISPDIVGIWCECMTIWCDSEGIWSCRDFR